MSSISANKDFLELTKVSILPGHLSEMLVLTNRQPQWSFESQNYVLNFHGRVTRVKRLNSIVLWTIIYFVSKASVKNFQIVSESDPSNVIMQFGKVGADIFTMDFR